MDEEAEISAAGPAGYPAGWFDVDGDVDDFIFYTQENREGSER